MIIWRWYSGEEELKVFVCLMELNKAYEIVVGEIVACKLRTNGISQKRGGTSSVPYMMDV